MSRTLPKTPEQLLEELFVIFPEFHAEVSRQTRNDPYQTYHSVLIDFTPFFGARLASFSEKQLRAFGELVSAAVAGGGLLENAFGTCLLEHLHQIRGERTFRPYLSKVARDKTRA